MFSIGIGPSSSHTVGPMRAARYWAARLSQLLGGDVSKVHSVRVVLYGSLAATGQGHSTPLALVLGLAGHQPHTVDPSETKEMLAKVWATNELPFMGRHPVHFGKSSIEWRAKETLPLHSNGMEFYALDAKGNVINQDQFYSIGGGFFVDREGLETDNALAIPHQPDWQPTSPRYPFHSATELMSICKETGMSIAQLALANEVAWTREEDIRPKLLKIWEVMNTSIERGMRSQGILPGGLNVRRRAASMTEKLNKRNRSSTSMDWMSVYAIAVNEENAAGGRVVTAPTNGAAGIIPAVLRYAMETTDDWTDEQTCDFLAVAGVVGMLYKSGASISAAEVGCQGEVGVACSMAAAALTHVGGGTVGQIEDAAEIAMEHNIGLSCDPIGGLVQIPCIERNVMGASKAVASSRLALLENGSGLISLDEVIKTMLETGREMSVKYKETADGGLAKNTLISKNVTEC